MKIAEWIQLLIRSHFLRLLFSRTLCDGITRGYFLKTQLRSTPIHNCSPNSKYGLKPVRLRRHIVNQKPFFLPKLDPVRPGIHINWPFSWTPTNKEWASLARRICMSETWLQLQCLPIGPFQWAAQAAAAETTEATRHQHPAYVTDGVFFLFVVCLFFKAAESWF